MLPDYKQVIVYNKKSNITFNASLKYIVLGSLNSVDVCIKISKSKVDNWLKFGQKKVTVQVSSSDELLSLQRLCENKKVCNVLVQTDNNTPCVLVLGPDLEKVLDPLTRHLKLF